MRKHLDGATLGFNEALERIKKATGVRTQTELAKLLGIRQATVSEAKKRGSIPAEWILKLYRTRGLNPVWLVDGVGPAYIKPLENIEGYEFDPAAYAELSAAEPIEGYGSSPCKSVKLYLSGGGQTPTEWDAESIGDICIPTAYYRPSLAVIKMDGSSMEPFIRNGAVVGIDKDKKSVVSGEVFAVHVPFEGLAIKRVYLDAENSRIILKSENPNHPPLSIPAKEAAERILGRAIWILQEI